MRVWENYPEKLTFSHRGKSASLARFRCAAFEEFSMVCDVQLAPPAEACTFQESPRVDFSVFRAAMALLALFCL